MEASGQLHGTVDSTGLYAAPATAGSATVEAAAGALADTASVTITSPNQAPTVATAAGASPNPVGGTTANLSVLGADDAGEANLTYTWSATGPAAVTYSANGTNAARNSIATFTRAGSYTFTVNVNATRQFTAAAYDQFGQSMVAQPAFTWSVISGGGVVDATGLYTAPATAGSATVQATAGGTASDTAAVTIAAPQPPAAPSSLTANRSGNRAKLTWTDNANNESGFHVWSSRDGVTWTLLSTVAASSGTGARSSTLPLRWRRAYGTSR